MKIIIELIVNIYNVIMIRINIILIWIFIIQYDEHNIC